MSTNITKKYEDLKRISLVILILVVLALIIWALTGCSSAKVDAPNPVQPPAPSQDAVVGSQVKGVNTFGSNVEFADGLYISVTKPQKYEATDQAMVDDPKLPQVFVELVIQNDSKEPYSPALLDTVSSGGEEGSAIFETDAPLGNVGSLPITSVLPGKSVKWVEAYSVKDPSDITLEVHLGFADNPVIFAAK